MFTYVKKWLSVKIVKNGVGGYNKRLTQALVLSPGSQPWF